MNWQSNMADQMYQDCEYDQKDMTYKAPYKDTHTTCNIDVVHIHMHTENIVYMCMYALKPHTPFCI